MAPDVWAISLYWAKSLSNRNRSMWRDVISQRTVCQGFVRHTGQVCIARVLASVTGAIRVRVSTK